MATVQGPSPVTKSSTMGFETDWPSSLFQAQLGPRQSCQCQPPPPPSVHPLVLVLRLMVLPPSPGTSPWVPDRGSRAHIQDKMELQNDPRAAERRTRRLGAYLSATTVTSAERAGGLSMDQTTARLLNRTERGLVLSEPIRAVDADHIRYPRGSLSAFEVSQKAVKVLNVTHMQLRRKHRDPQQHAPCRSIVRTCRSPSWAEVLGMPVVS